MKKLLRLGIFVIAFWMGAGSCWSQVLPGDVSRIEDNKLIFKISTEWSEKQFQEFSKTFSLDSIWLSNIVQGAKTFTLGEVEWTINQLSKAVFEVSKALSDPAETTSFSSNWRFLDLLMSDAKSQENIPTISYGRNQLINPELIQQNNNQVTITLERYYDAKSVYLSGSFNNWALSEAPMKQSDQGWEIQITLGPGKYFYKFIVDGQWTTDPNNQLQEDYQSNTSSVFYVYNYQFKLKSYNSTQRVIVAGSFNNFNENELRMEKNPDNNGWILDLYLSPGTHYYKFIADQEWILDPENPKQSPDGKGNTNSVLGLGTPYSFFLSGFEEAKKVELAGSFNNWQYGEIFLEKTDEGWSIDYFLGPGTYTYKFIVDGLWTIDPANPNTIGTGDYINSVLTIKPNHQFVLNEYQDASEVMVTGTFNAWDESGYKMIKEDGKWIFPIFLPPGKYTYKFIVDKQWILDPDNDLWEENEHGTDNSVLWIDL